MQVKSTTFKSKSGYSCAIKQHDQSYSRGSFDFVAVYVVPKDVWYIIPANKLAGRDTVTVCSDSARARFEEYREAWHLLREASQVCGEEQRDGAQSGGDQNDDQSGGDQNVEQNDNEQPRAAEAPAPGSGIHPANAVQRVEWIANIIRIPPLRSGHRRDKRDDDS